MANRLRIAVLTHEFDEFDQGGYLLAPVCEVWRRAGMTVEIVQGLPSNPPAADVAVLHTNMTKVDPAYVELAHRYPIVINGRATDISKRRVSSHVVASPEAYSGPVVVKTDANYGGLPEEHHARASGQAQGGGSGQPKWATVRTLHKYPIFRSTRDVPPTIWSNPHLVVDKFMPERNAGGEFVLRVWIFLGGRSLHYCCMSREPLIKSNNTIRREQLDVDAIPEEIRKRRIELGFDYGKFDYVEVDGRAWLLDANKTPGLPGGNVSNPESLERLRQLSEGLKQFVADEAHATGHKVTP